MGQPWPSEPTITINGVEMPVSASMTLRVALEAFAMQLHSEGLGGDEAGDRLVSAYMHNIAIIRDAMHRRLDVQPAPVLDHRLDGSWKVE